ncbi:hypothetical protein PPYR_13004 [Photinus pyralis]|uniref:Uncharacterized protein n=1 Tax=Photinus pyralis TaxID=7054 RepID=A0A1Y1MC90_PHOPY|nr:sodium-independent sulfate anion transporter-like [Photinus pyralis]XP_031354529.1 sodium-independent sulfate anion transporter-like [Photinus pyralis]KAB0793384.1 hypothetical protein PPYR_13004 [Photinus pyralis]
MIGDNGDNHRISINALKGEGDLRGVAGGGGGGRNAVYTNEALSESTISMNPPNEFVGSNDFILVDENKTHSTKDAIKSIVPWMKRKAKGACTKKMLYRRLPILSWLPKYNSSDAIGDLVAGITVGLTVIPQSLAYSNVAGLPAEYGLYGSFLGCFVYIFFGSCKDVPVGPTAIASLLTFQAVRGHGPAHAILLCFLTGLLELLMGLLGLGFIIDFVSGPVSSGFTSAVALIIVTSQVKDILAIKVSGSTFVEQWISIFSEVQNSSVWDAVLGISCIAVLLIMRIVATIKIGPTEVPADEKCPEEDKPTIFHKIVNKFLWMFGTSRNAILVVIGGFIGYSFYVNGTPPFKLIGDIPQGLPDFKVPSFGYTEGNNTVSFTTMVSDLGSGIIVVAMIALLENIAICKAFANGKTVDATQELIAIGLCNIANSFVQGYPGTGSLSRSAVNNASGVRTPFGSFYTGLLVIIALLFFTPYFFYVPKAALAAVIIAAVVFMVEVKVVKPMWRTKKSDLIPGLGTFIACLLLPLEIGILIGIGINLLFILYHAARPKITVERLTSRTGIEYLMLTPDRCLIFPSVDYVRNLVTKHSIRQAAPAVIDCSHIYGADYTAATVIETLTKDFAGRDQPLIFYNLKPSVCAVFEGLSPKEFVVCYTEDELDRLLKSRNDYKPKDVLQV